VADPHAQRICNTALGQLRLYDTGFSHNTWLRTAAGLRVELGNFAFGEPMEFMSEWLITRSMLLFSGAKGSDKQGSNFADFLTIRPLDPSNCGCYGFPHPLSCKSVGLRGLPF
jgi:hypothetical protein